MRLVTNFLRQPRLCQTLQYEKQVVIYYKNNIYFNIDQELTSFFFYFDLSSKPGTISIDAEQLPYYLSRSLKGCLGTELGKHYR